MPQHDEDFMSLSIGHWGRQAGGAGRMPGNRAKPCGLPYPCRATIIVLILPIASAGFSPFGQVRVQFMMVWQR